MNREIKITILVIVILLVSGIAYAVNTVIKKFTYSNVTMNPTYQSTLDQHTINNLWIGTLDLAWKELQEKLNVDIIQLEWKENLQIVSDLNASMFSKEMLHKEDYEINLQRKETNAYKIEATLNKNLNFLEPFDNFMDIYRETFGDGEQYIKYFGINNGTKESVNSNVEILFYNNSYKEINNKRNYNDFAIKLKTKEGDEIILYRTDEEKSFDEYYEEIKCKTKKYEGNKELTEKEELRIPYIKVNGRISYDELVGKTIKHTNNMYISDIVQNVEFALNEKGCNVSSTATMCTDYMSISERKFNFTDTFILFMKERNIEYPYFAIKVDNDDILEKIEEEYIDYVGPVILDYTEIQHKDYDASKIQAREYKFYEDEDYEYYYFSEKTDFVRIYNPYGEIDNITAEEAVKEGIIDINLFDRYGIEYIKKEK